VADDHPVTNIEDVLRAAYKAFNARDVEEAIVLMHPDVNWPNAWEGGRVVGRLAVADYWRRQFESISSKVEPESFDHNPDGSVTVLLHQVVSDAKTGALLADEHVAHRYWATGRLDRPHGRRQATGLSNQSPWPSTAPTTPAACRGSPS